MGKTKQQKKLKKKKIKPKIDQLTSTNQASLKTILPQLSNAGSSKIKANDVQTLADKQSTEKNSKILSNQSINSIKLKRKDSTMLLDQFYQMIGRTRPRSDKSSFSQTPNKVHKILTRSASACARLSSPSSKHTPLSIDQSCQTTEEFDSPSYNNLELKQDNLLNCKALPVSDTSDIRFSKKRIRKHSSSDNISPNINQPCKKSKSMLDSTCVLTKFESTINISDNITTDNVSKCSEIVSIKIDNTQVDNTTDFVPSSSHLHTTVSHDGYITSHDKKLKNSKNHTNQTKTCKSFNAINNNNKVVFDKNNYKSIDGDGTKINYSRQDSIEGRQQLIDSHKEDNIFRLGHICNWMGIKGCASLKKNADSVHTENSTSCCCKHCKDKMTEFEDKLTKQETLINTLIQNISDLKKKYDELLLVSKCTSELRDQIARSNCAPSGPPPPPPPLPPPPPPPPPPPAPAFCTSTPLRKSGNRRESLSDKPSDKTDEQRPPPITLDDILKVKLRKPQLRGSNTSVERRSLPSLEVSVDMLRQVKLRRSVRNRSPTTKSNNDTLDSVLENAESSIVHRSRIRFQNTRSHSLHNIVYKRERN